MELGTKSNNYCAFTVYFEGSDEAKKDQREDAAESIQEAFEKFRRRRQEAFRSLTKKKVSVPRKLQDPDAQWQLRLKFLEQAKGYIGVPYAKKYHEPGTPEYDSPLFLDCCGFIRRVMHDLAEEFGFSIGLGNQAYQYDTLPVSLPSEEYLKPGDLIFISGTYFDVQRKRQPHDIVHVEIWLGYGERSLGARWKRGKVQVFGSYRFVSQTYGGMEYHYKSIDTWLQGICTSHCPEHKWASARQLPGRRSIFRPLSDQDEPPEEDVGAKGGRLQSQLGKEKIALRMEPIVESISSCELSDSNQMEALDLQGFSTLRSGITKTNTIKRDRATEANQSQSMSLESSGPSVGCSNALLEGSQVHTEGFKEGPMKSHVMCHSQEADAHMRPTGLPQDSLSYPPKKSHSTSKLNVKGILAGGTGKRKKKGKPGTEGGHQHFDGLSSVDADSKRIASRSTKPMQMFENQMPEDTPAEKQNSTVPTLAEGEPTNETKSKVPKAIPKASPRMSHQEEKKPEEALASGPFFYIGGANGVDLLNLYCKNRGWQRIYDNRREDYILKWCETKFRDTYYNFKEGEQLLYQIPNNKILTTKIGLLMNLREYERVMKKINRAAKVLRMEDFFPETFRLDTKDERELFFETYKEPHIWICKPTSSNQGRGIFLLKNQAEVKDLQTKLQSIEDDPLYRKLPYRIPPARIVQRYIDKPLLLEGKKFDVRSYLLIACTVPYMLFFGHGYVRLTCLNYDPKSEDLTSHLTNQYVQKKSPMYPHVKEETVWCMDRFNTYVNEKFRHAKGLPKDWVLNSFTKRMKEIMLQCFLAVKSKLDCKVGYFDLIGCDFLIDEDFKVWLLEMNSNPALHTNCNALKGIIPTVVNETLDLVIEIFTKIQKKQSILPLETQGHFVLLYSGAASDIGLSRASKSRTSLHSFQNHRPQPEISTSTSASNSTNTTSSCSGSHLTEKQPPKALEKVPKGEAKGETAGPPEGLSLAPSKGVPRNPLPMPQIQISIVPNLSCCPSVRAVLRGNQVCNSGSQYIIRHTPEVLERPLKAEESDDRGKLNLIPITEGISKDRSYATWFQQTFGTKLALGPNGNGAGGPLTSSQMLSLHLQSNLPPSLPLFQEFPKPFRQLMAHAKPPTNSPKAIAAAPSRSCDDALAEDKKTSHRGS
ncbi:LOW QUALITY PROTEIN: inactive polyglycylase TTLL10 [Sceloporus undulatus]|uniref:LOW QUALITY PROTEIN: inactive polyglycylase TTLL10 n=1 Tax=Sceloporus undulatus TaxID=8520 RepID=UPI001C4AFB77|nr:LOW QUALITY PROTEIN: inactive polyglycylase TTLL10 [Sceloporus undulatus]